MLDQEGYLAQGLTVHSKRELAEVLQSWLQNSATPTIGDIGRFGGKPWLHIELGNATAELNADTKRDAVQTYLDEVRRVGPDMPWLVVANQRGRINKVVFQADGEPTAGWFCYLSTPFAEAGTL